MVKWYQLSSIFVTGYSGSTVVSIKENNIELQRKSAITGMVPGSFFHDEANRLLYLWPIDGDNPNSSGKTYIFYSWIGFADEDGVNFPIQGESEIYYIPAIDAKNTPPFSQSITELFTGDITQQFGDIQLTYPEWFLTNKDNYVWKNSTSIVKMGVDNPAYGNYTEIFHGYIDNMSFQENGPGMNLVDLRNRLFTTIPSQRYLIETFPYISDQWHYQARVILVGEKKGIHPAYINTNTYTYEISQVEFEFNSFPGIESIDAVYKDGIQLSTPGDYTADLANGQFSLTAPPGSSIITCDARGLKLSRDFTGLTWTNQYSANIADITYFFLRLQRIEPENIDENSFQLLQTSKQYVTCGDWLCQRVDFSEKLKELQPAGRFHLLPAVDGTLRVILYSDSSAPAYVLSQYSSPVISYPTQNIMSTIWLRYDKTPQLNTTETEGMENLTNYKLLSYNDPRVSYKYQVEKAKNFKTILNNEGDAAGAASEILTLYQKPWETFSVLATMEAIDWVFLSKVAVYYYQIINGIETNIYTGDPFIIIGKIINWEGGIQLLLLRDPSTPKLQYIQDHDLNYLQDHAFNNLQT